MAEGQSAGVGADKTGQKGMVFLKDYRVSAYLIKSTRLTFDLQADRTIVSSCLTIQKNPASDDASGTLVLEGEDLMLRSVAIDGEVLAADRYTATKNQLSLYEVADSFELEILCEIDPASNLALEGLYLSDGMYCTQCEAEGFRRMTYYLDRPDVMSVFTTKIIADKQKYPVLLSNGNLVGSGELDSNRHWVEWHDPFKKPSYLFALVAGDLQVVEDAFTTQSGRQVRLQIFVEQKDLDKCGHAMLSLKNAMRWDEQVYGREYDLDLYMIVAVDFFNMGAMENKGLNIFNTSCVLAHPKTQTDAAFQRVEGVIAHEYFHNWSGNRVTCRDWFQLSLKEGFTVFRDASFSADMNSVTVKRIEDVGLLRSAQFAEDNGPMSHPVRPESYMEISNFYTLTIYEKGAELIRMMHQLLGAEQFRAGTDLYFERHDGQAVTCEDFVVALEDASGVDLSQFRHWYSQSGTPILNVSDDWNADSKRYTLNIRQSCPPTPGQTDKQPFYLPVNMALLTDDGLLDSTEQVLTVSQPEQSWTFEALPSRPVPSLLRGFSAPVKLHYDYALQSLLIILQQESDGFARWDASRRYMMQLISDHVTADCRLDSEEGIARVNHLADALLKLLEKGVVKNSQGTAEWDPSQDAAMLAEILQLPGYAYIVEQFDMVDIAAIASARNNLREALAVRLRTKAMHVYQLLAGQLKAIGEYCPRAEDIALRSLKNICLGFLLAKPDAQSIALAKQQYDQADNMTDQSSALNALVNCEHADAETVAEEALNDFYQRWQRESLVVNQWLSIQVCSEKPGAFQRLQKLTAHCAYDNTNPNKVRALLGAFCVRNLPQFHAADGSTYDYLAGEVLRLNEVNPQLAARLLAPLTQWRRFNQPQQVAMQQALQRINNAENLSADVLEVVSKTLGTIN